jgi:hypothetical protein
MLKNCYATVTMSKTGHEPAGPKVQVNIKKQFALPHPKSCARIRESLRLRSARESGRGLGR